MSETGRNVPAWEQIARLGSEQYEESFTGIELTPRGVVVFRRPCERFDHAIRALAADPAIIIRDSKFSAQHIRELMAMVWRDLEYWRAQSVNVSTIEASVDGDVLIVGVSDSSLDLDLNRLTTSISVRYELGPEVRVVRSPGVSSCD